MSRLSKASARLREVPETIFPMTIEFPFKGNRRRKLTDLQRFVKTSDTLCHEFHNESLVECLGSKSSSELKTFVLGRRQNQMFGL